MSEKSAVAQAIENLRSAVAAAKVTKLPPVPIEVAELCEAADNLCGLLCASGDVDAEIVKRLREKFKDKDYRTSYINAHTKNSLAAQLRELRGDKSQQAFADEIGRTQTVVARLENPSYGKWSLSTILDIAAVLDKAVVVKFMEHDDYLLSRESAWMDISELSEKHGPEVLLYHPRDPESNLLNYEASNIEWALKHAKRHGHTFFKTIIAPPLGDKL